LVQAVVFPGVDVGNNTALGGLVNVTAVNVLGSVELPYQYENGSSVFFGDPDQGYPSSLYPNLTYGPNTSTTSAQVSYEGRTLDPEEMLMLGPLVVNDTYALLSGTLGIVNNSSPDVVLGWLTVVIDASMLFTVQESREGLGDSGEVLLVGPDRRNNLFETRPGEKTEVELQDAPVRFILPPTNDQKRHESRSASANTTVPFPIGDFPAVEAAYIRHNNQANNAGAFISTNNEDGDRISAGYALVNTSFVDWVLVVEQDHGEVIAPINHLRDVVLICVFSVTGFLLLVMFPMAHYSITPIRQLRAATAKTVEPYLPEDGSEYASSYGAQGDNSDESPGPEQFDEKKDGFFAKFRRHDKPSKTSRSGVRRRTFRIPSKVPERKHFVVDELTDLTSTFNEMSDELTMQYERLEERVRERTAELERSKRAAEAANQSKTLFIANISHELKTPLNGILGLTTVCMNEDDISKIRSTLSTIYKSGDLLLHLLTDLLTFSKNEVGQQLSIDETEFRISDLSTQLMPTFEKQAREAQVDLKVLYLGTNDAFGNTADSANEKVYGPSGTGRIKDMCLWGDKNRILQVLMNFTSNSLKFTPPHGSVTVRIRCTGVVEHVDNSRQASLRKSSVNSRKSKSSSHKKVRMSDSSLPAKGQSESDLSDNERVTHHGTPTHPGPNREESKLSITLQGGTAHVAKIVERRRSASPPPLNTKDLRFEFEVEDTGPGIPEDQQQKIFEPFVQGDLGLSKKYGGTGLGLSICAQLAALMGGHISLDSKVNHGSKFTMSIPLRYVSERAASSASSMIRTHSKASSLVGQTLHNDSDPAFKRQEDSSSSSETGISPEHLADVPRIVGFTQPYVASETKPDTAKAKLKEMRKAVTEAAKTGKKVRVLVAEDNPVNQEVVLRMLKLEDVYGEWCLVMIKPKLTCYRCNNCQGWSRSLRQSA
jgi:osomolarity two-component system, sensor histidine kinase SLN1